MHQMTNPANQQYAIDSLELLILLLYNREKSPWIYVELFQYDRDMCELWLFTELLNYTFFPSLEYLFFFCSFFLLICLSLFFILSHRENYTELEKAN